MSNGKSIADFGVIPTLTQAVGVPTEQLEVNQNTVDVDDCPDAIDSLSKSDLQHAVRKQRKTINELEFELEQRDVRVRGLRKELAVREEITSSVNEEVREAQKQVVNAADKLESMHNELTSLRAALDKANDRSLKLEEEVAQTRDAARDRSLQITELQHQLRSTLSELSDLRNYVDGRKEEWQKSESEMQKLQLEINRLAAENQSLRNAPRHDAEAEIKTLQKRIAEQSGEISACTLEIERLRNDNVRFEEYSNELRLRLQDQLTAAKESTVGRRKLETSLDAAQSAINSLTLKLEEEKSRVCELHDEHLQLKEEHWREIRQIRFELTTAHEMIADQETANEQLASDLVNNREFRAALETHVSDVERQNRKTIKRLQRELGKFQDQAADYERKLRIKDGAIADLMKELADHSSKLDFSKDLEKALQKIDGFRPDQRNTGQPGARDRITRQLIGSADGKELRFPLFRDRLTIGRTAHNDIQLAMRFVSRRHAVIATDNKKTRIIDWGSRNGVYVNKRRVTEKILKSGDVLTIGLTNLRDEERPKRGSPP